MKKKREFEVFNLSFLDCICCGFGAIILLFVLSKAGEPQVIEEVKEDLSGLVKKLEEELFEIRGEVTTLNRDLPGKVEQLSEEKEKLARLQGDLSKLKGEFAASTEMSAVRNEEERELAAARQTLTEEMKRLLRQINRPPAKEQPVGGIPVDSEYVIFIVDTSGSMKNGAWPLVMQKMEETLKLYPKLKGFQVMNDMGRYMFPTYARRWVPDSPARRRILLKTLGTWNAYSNSSPVEGIQEAIRSFASDEHKVSIFVFGDEFSGSSMDQVLSRVDLMNTRADGSRRVRIHGVGFPVVVTQQIHGGNTGVRFSVLMRELCRRNEGSFVALNRTSP